MSALPYMISATISAYVSKKRVQNFLLSEELDQFHGYGLPHSTLLSLLFFDSQVSYRPFFPFSFFSFLSISFLYYRNIVPRVLMRSTSGKRKKVRFSDRLNLLSEEDEEEEFSDFPSLKTSTTLSLDPSSIETLSLSPKTDRANGAGMEMEGLGERQKVEQSAILQEVSPPLPSSFSIREEVGAGERKVALRIVDGEFAWSGGQADPVILSGINLEVKEREFVVVLGPVGCGKSSLLAAMLHEMHKVSFFILFYSVVSLFLNSIIDKWPGRTE